jgi:hypothetical protein
MWKQKLQRIVDSPIAPSKKRFCNSVLRQIEEDEDRYPTANQTPILKGIWHSYLKKYTVARPASASFSASLPSKG